MAQIDKPQEPKKESLLDRIITAGEDSLVDNLASGSLISSGGSILFNYMQNKEEEARYKREMDFRNKQFEFQKKQFGHQQSMDFKSSDRQERQVKMQERQDSRTQQQYINANQKDAQMQEKMMSQLRILNKRYGA